VTAFSIETTIQGKNGAQKLAKFRSGSTIKSISLESRILTASLGGVSILVNIAKGLSNDDGWHRSKTADIGINVIEIGLRLFEATSPIGWIFGAGMFVGNLRECKIIPGRVQPLNSVDNLGCLNFIEPRKKPTQLMVLLSP
jgi:hypothetical protein